jgi:hypothetical protein
MYQVLLNDTVVAESANKPTVVEGNYYFAPEHVMMEYFTNSNTQCVSPSLSRHELNRIAARRVLGKGKYRPTTLPLE